MAKSFDIGKDEVAKLAQYFAQNKQQLVGPGTKEAHVRQLLIDPMFEALGWDVRNEARHAPQYREVIPEDSLDIEGQQKAPDYAFRVGQTLKFYAEANLEDSEGKSRFDRMVSLVESMLDLHEQLPQSRSESESSAIQRQSESIDREIDALVYELYGLTEAEIAIVEGKVV